MTRWFALLFLIFTVSAEAAETVRVENHVPDLDRALIEAARAQVAREYVKLKALFGTDIGPVILVIRAKGVGRHKPPNRILIPAAQLGNAKMVSAHELTHLLTQGWANGLMKEGLAIYGQDMMGESPAWPNYGQDIHQAAWAEISAPDPLVRGPGDANGVLTTPHPGESRLRIAAYRVVGALAHRGKYDRQRPALYGDALSQRQLQSGVRQELPATAPRVAGLCRGARER